VAELCHILVLYAHAACCSMAAIHRVLRETVRTLLLSLLGGAFGSLGGCGR
jgi:hypothetical protein